MADQSSIAFDRFRTDDVAAADALLRSRENTPATMTPPRADTPAKPEPEPAERQAAPEAVEKPPTANPISTDTLAADATESAAPQHTETQNANPNGNGSAFAKDAARRDTSWKALNNEKARIAADRAAIQQERIRLQEEQSRFQQQQQGAAKNKLTPEMYDQSATQQEQFVQQGTLQLRGLIAMKAEHEDKNQYTEAAKVDAQIEDMREKIAVAKYQANQFKNIAQNMRANPELQGDALQKRNKELLMHYTVEAAKQWPELAQANSEFQKATARTISVLKKSGLDEDSFPILRHFAAEHVAAATAAARVPALEKELAQARARIKELEPLTTPGGGTSAAPNLRPSSKPASLEAEGDALRREAELKGAKG